MDRRRLRPRLLLSLQRAMWETVTPDLRGVAVRLRPSEAGAPARFAVRFLYEAAVDELREELVSLVETYVVADFTEVPDELTVTVVAEPSAAKELAEGEEWFFLRWEPGAWA